AVHGGCAVRLRRAAERSGRAGADLEDERADFLTRRRGDAESFPHLLETCEEEDWRMDVQAYYGKGKQEEQRIGDEFPVIGSHETAGGGIAGRMAEVARRVAARFIALGAARLATHDESKIFRDAQLEAKQAADALLEQAKLEIAMLAMKGVQKLQTVTLPNAT